MTMKKIAIAIDKWKLKFFEEQLKKGNYNYRVLDGVTETEYMLTLEAETVDEITPIVKKALQAADNSKRH